MIGCTEEQQLMHLWYEQQRLYITLRIVQNKSIFGCSLVLFNNTCAFWKRRFFLRGTASREEYEICISISVSVTVQNILQSHLLWCLLYRDFQTLSALLMVQNRIQWRTVDVLTKVQLLWILPRRFLQLLPFRKLLTTNQRHYIAKQIRRILKSATSQPFAESRFLLGQIVRQPVAVACGCPAVFWWFHLLNSGNRMTPCNSL